jgi:hypothetical protein
MRAISGHRALAIILLGTFSALLLFTITVQGQTGCVAGAVIDENSHPLANMNVEALGLGLNTKQTQTGSDGRFQIDGLTPNQYRIMVGDRQGPYPNHASQFYYGKPAPEVLVTSSDICQLVAVKLGPKVAKLNLAVLDAITKQTIDEPMVELLRAEGSGIETVAPGGKLIVPSNVELQLKLQAVGYEKSASIKLPAFYPEEIRALTVELRPAAKGCLSGSVTGEDNLPVAGAKVVPRIGSRGSFNEDHSVLTGGDGRFQINELELAPYHVYVEKVSAGYLGTQSVVEVNLSSQSPCTELPLKIGVKAARLRIVAIDAKTRKEISQIHTAYANEERSSTYSSIVERLPGNLALVEPLRKLSVTIYADGYEEDGKRFFIGPLAPNEMKDITVELQPLKPRTAL